MTDNTNKNFTNYYNYSSSDETDSIFDDLSTLTDISLSSNYSLNKNPMEYQNTLVPIDEYSDYSSDYSSSSNSSSSNSSSRSLSIKSRSISDYDCQLDEDYRKNFIQKIISNNYANNIQNINTKYYLKPFNYVFYKFCVLFGNLFMFLTDWKTCYRPNNMYNIFNYVESSEFKNFEEDNYYNVEGINSLKTEKSYIIKYNNSNSLFEKLMLLSFLWKNKLCYQIMWDKKNFKWYNKHLLKYLGFVSVDSDNGHFLYYYPLNYYFDDIRNKTNKTLLIFHLTDFIENDNSYFYMCRYLKCPLMIMGLDHFSQKVVVDGILVNNDSLRYTNKLLYKRLSYYPPIGKNKKLDDFTNDYDYSYEYRMNKSQSLNIFQRVINNLKYKSYFGNNFRILILMMPFFYMWFSSCYFHYFYKLVLAKQYLFLSYIDHTLYFFKNCMV